MIIKNPHGFSVTEILIGLAISGVMVLGGVQLMRSTSIQKASLDQEHNEQTVQKLVEGKLFTPKGCLSLKGHKVGELIQVEAGKEIIKAGSNFGSTLIKELKFQEFIPADEIGQQGVAQILMVTTKGQERESRIEISIPVTLAPDASIQNCNLMAGIDSEKLKEKLCSGSFGILSAGKDCSEVLALIQELSIKSICEDIYGYPENAKYVGIHCNFNLVHSNKQCPTGRGVTGFDQKGRVLCKPL